MTIYHCPHCSAPLYSRPTAIFTDPKYAFLKIGEEVDFFQCSDDCPMRNHSIAVNAIQDTGRLSLYGAMLRFDVHTGELIEGAA
jgi:hypothetical protein